MNVLVVGASGAIGSRLVPRLVGAGHTVVGTYRHAHGADRLRALNVAAAPLDLLDGDSARRVVFDAEPDAIIHQATALADVRFGRNLDRTFEPTNQLRETGTDNLLAAAREAGVDRIVAQSFANYRYARTGGPVKSEGAPLDPSPPPSTEKTNAAMSHLDRVITAAGGIVLRYGSFYGSPGDSLVEPVRKRIFPIVDGGGGIISFIHLDDAAAATVLALEHSGPVIYNVVDDDPAPVSEWLPVLAESLGAKQPRRVPRWLARLLAGKAAVAMGTESRGASNASAKADLAWTLTYPSWREGFPAVYEPLGSGSDPASPVCDPPGAVVEDTPEG